jgi:hypothetical protein
MYMETTMQDEIQRRAYALWEADGSPAGQDQTYWFKAVAELAAEAAKTIKSPPRKRAPRAKKAAAAA